MRANAKVINHEIFMIGNKIYILLPSVYFFTTTELLSINCFLK